MLKFYMNFLDDHSCDIDQKKKKKSIQTNKARQIIPNTLFSNVFLGRTLMS